MTYHSGSIGFDDRSQFSHGGFRGYVRTLWRKRILIVVAMAAGLGAAFLVRSQIIPRYEAESQLILDVRNTTILKFDAVVSGLAPQPEVVRTEMDAMGSRGMAERVLAHLSPTDVKELADDGARTTPMSRFFVQTWPGFVDGLVKWIPFLKHMSPPSPSQPGPAMKSAVSSSSTEHDDLVSLILQGLKISNDGRSYTIHIGFSSPHPHLAAAVANTYAQQYMANQIDAKADATKRATEFLSQRLVDLRRDLRESETSVATFQRAAGMLDDKSGTIITQQISETNAELTIAHNQRIEAEAHLLAAQSLIAKNGDLLALSDVLSSQSIQTLRAKQTELARQKTLLDSQYTAKYPNIKTLQTDADALQSQINEETRRLVGSLENQVQIARNKEQGLQQALVRLQQEFGQGSESEVKLKQLQREADANRTVYEAYLGRLKQITEQQQLQEADAHVISWADVPTVPTYPRYRPMLALGLIIGGISGVAIAFLRESHDQRMRSLGQVEEITGIPVVALMPSLPWYRLARPENYVLLPGRGSAHFNEALRSAWAAVLLTRGAPERSRAAGLITDRSRLQGSRRRPAGRVILVTSSVPNEGKTSFCLSMARSLAAGGHKVLLIDADLRRPGVAKSLGGSMHDGRMTELLEGKITLQDAVQIDERSGAHYLAGLADHAHPQDILNTAGTKAVLDMARSSYEIVLIDTPPTMVAADAALLAKYADRCFFFIRWNTTTRDVVMSALRRLALYDVKINGIILSHVNLRKHAQYEPGEGYYHSYGRARRLPVVVQAQRG
jgi:succinoglycan biosynthesis transport protein ExoP